MKNYVLVNPFTYKPIQFSTFFDDDYQVVNIEGNNITVGKALCVEVEKDFNILNKTFNLVTNTFE